MASNLRGKNILGLILMLIICFQSLIIHAQAPTHTSKFDNIDPNINGFWQYLPRDFQAEGSRKYPLLIFIHGAGESGADKNQQTLDRLLNAGIPKMISKGQFPESISSGGVDYRFIVLSPQIKSGIHIQGTVGTSIIEPSTIDAVIQYARTAFPNRIDENRIYLAGLSMGGGAIWDYAGSSKDRAKKIAAVVIAAGAGDLSTEEANNIAAANLPILATHNNVDNIVLPHRTRDNINKILNYKPTIVPAPQTFYWDSPGTGADGKHNVWSRTFEDLQPGTTQGGNLTDRMGMSAYQWMLQFSRGTAPAAPATPAIPAAPAAPAAPSVPATPATPAAPATPAVPAAPAAPALPPAPTFNWLSFTSNRMNSKVLLEWRVSADQQVSVYNVERSTDGTHYISIASVSPAINANQVHTYQYTDATPSLLNYYRIKQTQRDGQFSYSTGATVDLRSDTIRGKIFPNPFNDKIEVSSSRLAGRKFQISLLSVAGVVLHKENREAAANQLNTTVNGLQSLSRGIYYLVVQDEAGNVIINHKLLKNN